MEVSSDFYENKLGWKRSESSNENIVFYKLKECLLALYPIKALAEDAEVLPDGTGFKGFTLAHNTESEKEVDDLIAKLKNKGVKIIKEPQKVFWGGYSSYIADPDDNLWEIAYNPFLKID